LIVILIIAFVVRMVFSFLFPVRWWDETVYADLGYDLSKNPFEDCPPYEKLVGDLSGAYSRRINIQHRLVYQVLRSQRVVKVIRMWTHYE